MVPVLQALNVPTKEAKKVDRALQGNLTWICVQSNVCSFQTLYFLYIAGLESAAYSSTKTPEPPWLKIAVTFSHLTFPRLLPRLRPPLLLIPFINVPQVKEDYYLDSFNTIGYFFQMFTLFYSDVCALRLDFPTFTTSRDTVSPALENNGCADVFTISVSDIITKYSWHWTLHKSPCSR